MSEQNNTQTQEEYVYISPDAGIYQARFYRFIDLGSKLWKNAKNDKPSRSFHVLFEIISDNLKEGQSNVVSAFFSWSKLYNLINQISVSRNVIPEKGGALEKAIEYLGSPVTLQLGIRPLRDGEVRKPDYEPKIEIINVYSLMDGGNLAQGEKKLFHLTFDNWDWEKYNSLSDGMKRLIRESNEFKELKPEGGNSSNLTDVEADYQVGNIEMERKRLDEKPVNDDDIPF